MVGAVIIAVILVTVLPVAFLVSGTVGAAVLGWLLFIAWRATLPTRELGRANDGRLAWVEPRWTLRWAVLSEIMAVIFASLDEFHQSFVPSRTASPYDVALDSLGALFALLVLMVALIGRNKPPSGQ